MALRADTYALKIDIMLRTCNGIYNGNKLDTNLQRNVPPPLLTAHITRLHI